MFKIFHLYIFHVSIIDFSIIAAYMHEQTNIVDKQIWRNYSDSSQYKFSWWVDVPTSWILQDVESLQPNQLREFFNGHMKIGKEEQTFFFLSIEISVCPLSDEIFFCLLSSKIFVCLSSELFCFLWNENLFTFCQVNFFGFLFSGFIFWFPVEWNLFCLLSSEISISEAWCPFLTLYSRRRRRQIC